jgi:hypothetical protein
MDKVQKASNSEWSYYFITTAEIIENFEVSIYDFIEKLWFFLNKIIMLYVEGSEYRPLIQYIYNSYVETSIRNMNTRHAIIKDPHNVTNKL